MVKHETVRVRHCAQPPTLVHKNVTISELPYQMMIHAPAKQWSSTSLYIAFDCCRWPTANKRRSEANFTFTAIDGSTLSFLISLGDFSVSFVPSSLNDFTMISHRRKARMKIQHTWEDCAPHLRGAHKLPCRTCHQMQPPKMPRSKQHVKEMANCLVPS